MNKIKALLSEIITRAYEISTITKTDVFVNYSGHVNWVEVRIIEDGWNVDIDFDYSKTTYLDRKDAVGELEEVLKKICEYEEN